MNLPNVPMVAVDTETTGLHPDDGARVAVVSAAWEGGSAAWAFDQGVRDKLPASQMALGGGADPNLGQGEWELLLDWLGSRALVFHNAKFDLTMLRAGTRHWPGADLTGQLAVDTMVAASVLDPLLSQGLDAAAAREGLEGKSGQDAVKAWLKQAKYPVHRYDLAPWDLVRPYAVADAEQTLGLWYAQKERLRHAPAELRRRVKEGTELCRVLCRVEARGVGYDAARSLEVAELLEGRADAIEEGMPFSCGVNEAKAFFFGQQGLTPDRRTEKREDPVLDEEQVRKWASQGVEWAQEYAQVTRARRAVSMWYRGYAEKTGRDGRLRTVYRQTRVKSGRMSVERVQLQAMPKADKYKDLRTGEVLSVYEGVPGVRELVRPAPGRELWNLDLSQAELRVAAKYSQCGTMLQLLEGGADMHGYTAEHVMGIDPDSEDWKFKRDIAKRLNFGAIFMIGGPTFQATLAKLADIHLPLAECKGLVAEWRRLYPEFEMAYGRAQSVAKSKGWVPLLPQTDRMVRSYFGERDWPNTAWNRVVQGSLAEFFKLWMVEVEAQAPGAMVLTIHDSVLLELDEGSREQAEAVADRGSRIASDLFGTRMPVDVDRW